MLTYHKMAHISTWIQDFTENTIMLIQKAILDPRCFPRIEQRYPVTGAIYSIAN